MAKLSEPPRRVKVLIWGSSDLSVLVVLTRRVLAAHPESVVVEVAVAVGEPSGLLDEHVDRLGTAVAQPVRDGVGEDLGAP